MRRMFRRWIGALLLAAVASAPAAAAPAILVWGDSLSAALGIPVESGWVQLLAQRLREQGYPHAVINGSVSGETTAGGLSRLPAALAAHRPALLLIELGGNDGLRGLPVKQMQDNLAQMVRLGRRAGARVLVFEMRLPPNFGPAYTGAFQRSFADVARRQQATLVPFFLAPLVGDPSAVQEDGIHPTARAQPRLLDAVWAVLQPFLGEKQVRSP
ncbi:MAG TPA: arylesterase [Candidatus Binatia bacterium]|nr:arylesterase [Candidatus Binatia bacterium]